MSRDNDRSPSSQEISLAQYIIQNNQFMRKAWKITLNAMEMFAHIDEIYAAYAESLDKPTLSRVEKRQAVINHVLNGPGGASEG